MEHRNPTISGDNLRLIFEATDNPMMDPANLYVAQRSDEQSDFGPPEAISGLNGAGWDTQPFLTADGQELWYATWRTADQAGYQIYRVPVAGSFGVPEFRDEFFSVRMEVPTLSADKLTIYLVAERPDNRLGIWRSSRATTDEEFPTPVLVPELNSTDTDRPGWLSPDNCRLYLSSERSGGRFQIYVATRQPG